MHEFAHRDGALHAEGVPLSKIADAVGTPLYCYSGAALERAYRDFARAFAALPTMICYSLKANGNLAVVRSFAALGAGADVVSEGELRRARAAGIPPERIVFSGVGKAPVELVHALDAGIHQINVESEAELERLSEIAAARGLTAPVALRVNPDVDAGTHAKMTTGTRENKFGIDLGRARAVYAHATKLPGIELVGLAVHIGSQLTALTPFRCAFERVRDLAAALREDGHRVSRVDLGGGLGIRYAAEAPPTLDDYARMVGELFAACGCEIILEPGRALVGDAGCLLTRVLYWKAGASRRFVVVDAAMNDLLRPSLYGAFHDIRAVAEGGRGPASPVDVVGPVCESADTFARDRPLPALEAGDLLAIGAAGAYGAVMASSYNSRLLVPEVLVAGDRFAVVRPRESFEDMLARDRIPDWLALPAVDVARGAA